MDGLCDVKGCSEATYMGWRPLTERRGRQICEGHWRRHRDEKDGFDLFDEFKFKRPVGKLIDKSIDKLQNPSTGERKTKKLPTGKMPKALSKFLRDECANFDNFHQVCILAHKEKPKTDRLCCVMEGRRCGYFEKAVLGPPDYPYRLPGYDYVKLFAQYADQTKTKAKKVKQRRCECGKPLQHRQRWCSKCREQRRRESYRNSKRRKRLGVHS